MAKWISSAEVNPSKLGFSSLKELQSFYEENCPGITDEIQGLADSLGVGPENSEYTVPRSISPAAVAN